MPIKAWTRGVPVEDAALKQLKNVAALPFIHKWVAAMPDVHWGIGATVGSVIPTTGAIIPAAVGVDIGCGMMAVQTTLTASDLPETCARCARPSSRRCRTASRRGARQGLVGRGAAPGRRRRGRASSRASTRIVAKHPTIRQSNDLKQLGTLGTGNHFIEVCLDEADRVWFMLHSGSRGVGNRIGTYFIELAKKDMRQWIVNLPDQDLAYFPEGTEHFDDYVEAVEWAQDFAWTNRELMMDAVVRAMRSAAGIPPFEAGVEAVNCHHNYVAREHHYGEDVLVTRKGAVRARRGRPRHHPGQHGRALVHRARAAATPSPSTAAATARAARCRAPRRSAASRWRTTRRRPRGSSAARTRT